MIELNSKWKVAMCLRSCWLLAVAALCVLGAIRGAEGAGVNGGFVEASPAAPVHSSTSIRANLASVAAASFEPGREGLVELATFTAKPGPAMLNVPAPGALSPAAPATDHIPEPGAIGFGLAVAALIFGNFAKALMRCWKITGTAPNRDR